LEGCPQGGVGKIKSMLNSSNPKCLNISSQN
jgi:hypothetical protein